MRLAWPLILASSVCASTAHADDGASPPRRTFADGFRAYQIEVAMTSAGPLRFTDAPDMTLDPTTVFVLGGRLGFGFGDPRADNHRLGLAVGYEAVARSEHRSLALITPHLTYETGHPLLLRLGVGYAAATGTKDFADHYGGLYTAGSLAWSFLDRARPGAGVSATLGLTAQVITSSDPDYRSAYLGGELTFRFHLGAQGGAR